MSGSYYNESKSKKRNINIASNFYKDKRAGNIHRIREQTMS